MKIRILGPLEAEVGGRPVALGPRRQRLLLAVLIRHLDEPVPAEQLIDTLWGPTPPSSARENLRSHIHALRMALGREHIGRHGRLGYLLTMNPANLDSRRFSELAIAGTEAMEARDFVRARITLGEALGLWRGKPFADLDGEPILQPEVIRLLERRFAVLEQRVDADLAQGRHTELIAELSALTATHPYRERFHAQLMLALYRSGRQHEALEVYQNARQVLIDELGVEPGSDMRRLHRQILAADPIIDILTTRDRPVPAQLPASVTNFVGRNEHLRRLNALLPDQTEEKATTVVISAVTGTAGVGKTALAVHWAHQVRDHFPDGQLYVNLRGFDRRDSPMSPAEAVRGFLEALGVPPERTPTSVDAQMGLYRSLLSRRRILVLLDNALDEEQVRPLVPGSPGCVALVTSRRQLDGLAATDNAELIPLGLLADEEARQLLTVRLGARRVAAEPAVVEDMITSCARLPLALAILAGRAAARPDFPLSVLADELSAAAHGLDVFAGEDEATDVRTVFSWSYETLDTDAARLFRLFGLHPGPDITMPAAASLAAVSVRQAQRLLTKLTRSHLLTEHLPGRYTCHDLLRSYAVELVHTHDSEAVRRKALRQLLDYYLHSSYTAGRLLDPTRERNIPAATAERDFVREEFLSEEAAMAWFTAIQPTLMAALRIAARTGFETHAQHLAWTFTPFLDRRCHWHEQVAAQHIALEVSERLADPLGQADARIAIGDAYRRLNRYDDACLHCGLALNIYRELGDLAGQARAHNRLALVSEYRHRYRNALVHSRQALDLFTAAGDRSGEGSMLNAVGWYEALLGNYRDALPWCEQALTVLQDAGDRRFEAHTWDSLGHIHHHLGDYRQATACYQRSLELFRKLDDRYAQATTLDHLGDTYAGANQLDVARTAWHDSLTILEQLGHPDAAQVRIKLDPPTLTPEPSTTQFHEH